MQEEKINDTEELQEKIIEKKPEEEKSKKEPKAFEGTKLSEQEKARYRDLITNVEKMKIIDELDTHLPYVDPNELTRADLDMLEKYLKVRRAGFMPEAVRAFEAELLEVQSRQEEGKGSQHYFLGTLRTKVTYQTAKHRGEVKKTEEGEVKEEGKVKEEKKIPKYQQEQLNHFWTQFDRLKVKDPNTILQNINHKHLGEEEYKIWKKFIQFDQEDWPKIRISKFQELLSKHKSIVDNLSKKGEDEKAMSIKNFIEYLKEEVKKENEQE